MRQLARLPFLGGACMLAAAACSGGAQDPPGASSAAAPATSFDPAPIASAASSAAGSASAPRLGRPTLAASDAPASERTTAALEILRGHTDAKDLAVEATDDGAPLDPTLRDTLSPRAQPPKVKMGATKVNGKLPPEVIERIVRQNYGRFRRCYEEALKQEPTLEGTIELRFVIEKDGSTSKATEGASTIANAGMRKCIVDAMKGLTFPKPEGGIVTVVYPLLFEPPIE